MKLLILFFIIFFLANCSKPKTVLICGDHVCVNKSEAEQYFEENLTIEVKIINRNIDKSLDLVELNLKKNKDGKKEVEVFTKKRTDKNIKKLSGDERIKIIENVKNKNRKKKIVKKDISKKNEFDKKQPIDTEKSQIKKSKNSENTKNNVNKNRKDVVDVCTILEKCNIEEISKFLLKQSKNKSFPDITTRQ